MKKDLLQLGAILMALIACSTSFAMPSNHLTVPVLNPNATTAWLIAAAAGADFPFARDNIYANNGSSMPSPYDRDTFTVKQDSNALLAFFAGRRWEQPGQWLPAASLALMYQHRFAGDAWGVISQNSLSEFTNYCYKWALSSDVLIASAKMNLYTKNHISPYVTGGLGVAFNHASYQESALSGVTPRISPDFSGNRNQLAYNFGAGLDFRATKQVIINLGYLYQNLGGMPAQGKGSWAGASLTLNSYATNEVLAGVTYLIEN